MKCQLLITALISTVAGKTYDRTKYITNSSPNTLSPQEIIDSFEAIGTDKYVNREVTPVGDYEQSLDGSKDSKSGKYVNKDTPPTRDYESFQANKEAELASLMNEIDSFMSNLNDQGDNFDILGLIKDGASAIWQKVKDFKEKFYG